MNEENVTIKQGISGGWIAFIVIVVLLIGGGLGYWYAKKSAKTTSEPSVSPTLTTAASKTPTASPTPTASATTDWKTYKNDQYGFSVTLTDNWQHYRYEEELPNDGSAVVWFRFYIPTTDKNWSDALSGYANPFVISVYTKAQWAAVDMNAPHDVYIGENAKYVIAYSSWQACPTDLCDVINSAELNKIKASIKVF